MSDRLFADSAERNKQPIADVLIDVLPKQGAVLEIASGTGQHVVHFASLLPDLVWQPSDIDPIRLASINAYRADSGLQNIRPAIAYNAATTALSDSYDAVVLVNLLHLISEPMAKSVVKNAAASLKQGGVLVIYGPFMRAGELTSDGDRAFHEKLQAQDPATGYKDDFDLIDWIQDQWLDLRHVLEMPANNMCFVAVKP